MSRQPNVVQAGGGNGMDVIGGLINTWQRKKIIDYRWGRDNQLLERQHELATERDRTKTMNNVIASGTSAAISNYFDTTLENTKSGNKITQTKEAGRQERLSETHRSKRAHTDAVKFTKGLYENSLDYSKGISPAVSINMQNVGNLLGGHPSLGLNRNTGAGENPATGGKGRGKGRGKGKGKPAPLPPQVGTDATPDKGWGQPELPFGDPGSPSVTGPKIKKPSAKKVSTGGGVTEIRNPKNETGRRGA